MSDSTSSSALEVWYTRLRSAAYVAEEVDRPVRNESDDDQHRERGG